MPRVRIDRCLLPYMSNRTLYGVIDFKHKDMPIQIFFPSSDIPLDDIPSSDVLQTKYQPSICLLLLFSQ